MSKTIILEFIKEFLRIGVVAIIPVLISQLENNSVSLEALVIVFVVAVLKAIDRAIHEYGKEIEDENLTKGILRF